MKSLVYAILVILSISCSNQEGIDNSIDQPELITFTHFEGSNMELCFDRNLDGYKYALEFQTFSGNKINSMGLLKNGEKWVDKQTCYSLKESKLPSDMFNKSTALKTLNWKIIDPEIDEIFAQGIKDIEVKSLLESLQEQENDKPELPWPHGGVEN